MASAALPLLDGATPLIGHLAQFFRDPVALLKRGYRARGRMFALNMMGRRMNVMLGPEHNRFFFEETDKLLSIRESMPFFLKMFSPDFYSFAEMDEYLRQRAIIMPRFKAASMKQYVPVMAEESLNLVNRLGDEGEFDLIPTLGPVVMDIARSPAATPLATRTASLRGAVIARISHQLMKPAPASATATIVSTWTRALRASASAAAVDKAISLSPSATSSSTAPM